MGDVRLTVLDKRSAILDSAEVVFSTQAGAATIDEIAKAAGVAKGTVYLYFKSKDELFISLIEERIAAYMKKTQDYLAAAASIEDIVTFLVQLRMEFVVQHFGLLNVLFQAVVPGSAEAQDRIWTASQNAQKPFVEAIDRVLGPNDAAMDPQTMVVMISGMADHLVSHRIWEDGFLDAQRSAADVLGFVLPCLRNVYPGR